MTRAASTRGHTGPDVAAYYGRRSAGGTALISPRRSHTAAGRRLARRRAELDGAEVLRLAAVTDAVHAGGGAIAASCGTRALRAVSTTVTPPSSCRSSPSGLDVAGKPSRSSLGTGELVLGRRCLRPSAVNAVTRVRRRRAPWCPRLPLDQFLWRKRTIALTVTAARWRPRTRFPAEVVATVAPPWARRSRSSIASRSGR